LAGSTTDGNILINASNSDFTLNTNFSVGIRNPLRVGLNQTNNSGYIEYGIPGATGYASGEITFAFENENAFGVLVTLSTGGSWGPTDADSSSSENLLGVSMGDGAGVLLKGFVRLSSFSGNIGIPIYLSLTSGVFTTSIASFSAGDYVRLIGHLWTNNTIRFNPDNTWVLLS